MGKAFIWYHSSVDKIFSDRKHHIRTSKSSDDLVELSALLINRRVNSACAALSRQASTPLDILSLVSSAEVTGRKHVKLVFLLVHAAVGEPEDDSGREGDDGDGSVVPDKMGIGSQRGKGLGQGSRERSGEALHGLDERAHVLGCLGEGVLKSSDGREDLRDGDEDVDTGDGPNGDGRLVFRVTGLVVTGGLVAANCQSRRSIGSKNAILTRSTGGQRPKP
jgi:hypothetical protein